MMILAIYKSTDRKHTPILQKINKSNITPFTTKYKTASSDDSDDCTSINQSSKKRKISIQSKLTNKQIQKQIQRYDQQRTKRFEDQDSTLSQEIRMINELLNPKNPTRIEIKNKSLISIYS
jgi:hypothetical protein